MPNADATRLSKVEENIRFTSTTSGCFAKGTRVFMRDGKKPIEEIQVGDYVLSSPENGSGKPEYKRVLNTFIHEPQIVYVVHISPEEDCVPNTANFVTATGNHLFWVEGLGWTRTDALRPEQRLRQGNGGFARVGGLDPIYRTGKPGIGWIPTTRSLDDRGTIFDYANYSLASDEDKKQFVYLPKEVLHCDDPFLRVSVYNIEIEDFHTYYVGGQHGFWVHN